MKNKSVARLGNPVKLTALFRVKSLNKQIFKGPTQIY